MEGCLHPAYGQVDGGSSAVESAGKLAEGFGAAPRSAQAKNQPGETRRGGPVSEKPAFSTIGCRRRLRIQRVRGRNPIQLGGPGRRIGPIREPGQSVLECERAVVDPTEQQSRAKQLPLGQG